MELSEALAAIAKRHGRGICPGLMRMEAALRVAGHPERRLRVVHIAGTNGKGSTAAMIAAIATAAGYKTGLYTSPTVTTLADTITVDRSPIPDTELAELVEKWDPLLPDLTEFELVTVLALVWFARQKVDLAVIECGLGGAEDATNVFPAPLCAVFTPISLDHTKLLGDSIEQIARQKAGIIKPNSAVVTCSDQHPEASGVLFGYAASLGLTVWQPAAGAETPPLSMSGEHQRQNAQTAIQTIKVLSAKGFIFTEKNISDGLAAVSLPCRQERIGERILLDGAHNPQGVAALAAEIRRLWGETPVVLLTGMLADKNVEGCVSLLSPLAVKVFCCTPAHPDRALPATALAAVYGEAEAISDIHEAVTAAKRYADSHNLPLIVAGSFYVAGEARELLR